MISFAFNDRIVARASATLDQWKAVEYGPLPIDRGDRTNVWVRDGDDLIRVGQIRGRGGAAQLGTVTVYDRTDGRLTGVLPAPRGARDGDGWRSGPVKSFDVASGRQIGRASGRERGVRYVKVTGVGGTF